jgi:hypothetical protein
MTQRAPVLVLLGWFVLLLSLGLGAAGCQSSSNGSSPGATSAEAPRARPLPPVTVQTLLTTAPRGRLVGAIDDGHVLFSGAQRLDSIALADGAARQPTPAPTAILQGMAKTTDGTRLGWSVAEGGRNHRRLSMWLYALPPGRHRVDRRVDADGP